MSVLLAPFRLVWRILTTILGVVGRLLMGLAGVMTIAMGVMLTLSLAGAVFGIPLIIVGAAVVIRALL